MPATVPHTDRVAGRGRWLFTAVAAVCIAAPLPSARIWASEPERNSLVSTPAPLGLEPVGRGAAPATGRAEVWVDLAMPGLAAVPMPRASMRSAYRHALEANQTALSGQLRALGATELARVHLFRSAIAVELPATAVDEVRKLPGVLQVRPITHLHRIDPPPPTQ